MKTIKILVTNQHTANFGDDAAGFAMASQLRQQFPSAELHFVYNWPWSGPSLSIPFHDSKTFHHNDLIIRKTDIADAIKYLASKVIPLTQSQSKVINDYRSLVRQSDFVIVSPGGSNIGIYQDWICLFRVLTAVLENKKPIFHLNSIGKSGNLLFDQISKFVLKRSQVFVREQKSHNELNQWSISNVRGVDTAFSLFDSKWIENSGSRIVDENSIVFIPTRLGTWHPLYKKINLLQEIEQKIVPSLVAFS